MLVYFGAVNGMTKDPLDTSLDTIRKNTLEIFLHKLGKQQFKQVQRAI